MSHHVLHSPGLLRLLLPQFAIVVIIYTLSGIGLATTPLFATGELGLGATAVGVISGAQFIAAIGLRLQAGSYCDRRGAASAVRLGLIGTILGGALCGLAWLLRGQPITAATCLLAGRIALGAGENYVIAGVQMWGLALAGQKRSAQVIGWVGTAAFSAMAVGAPLGGYFYQMAGFCPLGVMTTLVALGMFIACLGLTSPEVAQVPRPPLRGVARNLRLQTGCMALGGFSYGAMVSFSVLLFDERQWAPNWAALTLFSTALVISRLLFGSLPDRIGGARAAWGSLLVLAAGMVVSAQPGTAVVGMVGAVLTGIGYAVVYPALCREAVHRTPPEARGTALAMMSASIYLTIGLGNPVLGLMADRIGMQCVFWFAGATALLAAALLIAATRRTG